MESYSLPKRVRFRWLYRHLNERRGCPIVQPDVLEHKWDRVSNSFSDGMTMHLTQMEEAEKIRQKAAQSIFTPQILVSFCHTALTSNKISGVMGRRRRELAGVTFISFRTYSNCGIRLMLGFPIPRQICS